MLLRASGLVMALGLPLRMDAAPEKPPLLRMVTGLTRPEVAVPLRGRLPMGLLLR